MKMTILFILAIKELELDVEINLDYILIVIYMRDTLIGLLFFRMNNFQKNNISILDV